MASASAKKWEDVQKKAFTHWVNSHLAKNNEHIDDLETGFSTGVELITLVEVLSGKKITTKWTKKPKLKVHKITNCFIALKFLQEDCGVVGLTISAEDIVNADRLTLILGFCWMLLRQFQNAAPAGEKGSSFEANLLAWLKETLAGYKDLSFEQGFKSNSLQNGKALLALLHEFNSSAVDYNKYNAANKQENCEAALKLSEQHAGIPIIIDPVELAEGKCEEKNMVLYLSLWYNLFKERQAGDTKESLMKRLKELEEKLRLLLIENEQLKNSMKDFETSTQDLNLKLTSETEEKTKLATTKSEITTKLGSLKESFASEKAALKKKIEELQSNIQLLKSKSDGSTSSLQNAKDEMARERDAVKEELRKTKEQLLKEKEELQAQHDELTANLKKNQQMKEKLEELMKQQDTNNKQTIAVLRKHVLRHVNDMHLWKGYLEHDREYEAGDIKVVTEKEIEKLSFADQVGKLDKEMIGENKRLQSLLKEREQEAAEVVSVNMGKKKKRLRKNELEEETKQETKPEPTKAPAASKKEVSTSSSGAKKKTQK